MMALTTTDPDQKIKSINEIQTQDGWNSEKDFLKPLVNPGHERLVTESGYETDGILR